VDANPRGWSDEEFDLVLARVLRGGVLLSAAVVAVGGVIFLARHGLEPATYHVFEGEPQPFRSVSGIVAGARDFSGRGLVQLGLLFLVATPIARVVFSIVGFVRQRDWLYAGVTAIVLALLAYSLLASR
jgi:uncharacterized membrane protein